MTSGESHDHGPGEAHGHTHGAGHGHGDPYVWQPPERRSRIGWWLLAAGVVLVALGAALRLWAES